MKHINAFKKRKEQDAIDIDRLNYILGQYVGIAMSGKKYLDKPLLSKKESKVMTDEDMEKIMFANNKLLGGKTK